MSSEKKQSPSLLDLMVALYEREQVEELSALQFDAAVICLEHDVEMTDLLEYPVDDYLKLYTPPVKPTIAPPLGWDKVYYGEAAFPKEEKQSE
jgi:hypothetical protein